jgi:hypothetical protein
MSSQVSDVLLAYIADISGHGLAAGQPMGMLKAAMRMALQFQGTPTSLSMGPWADFKFPISDTHGT